MNKQLLTYGLAVVIGSGMFGYSAFSQQPNQRGQIEHRGTRERPSQPEGVHQRPERPGEQGREGERFMNPQRIEEIKERVQKFRDFSEKLGALREYKLSDEEKDKEYHQRVDALIKEYQSLLPQPPIGPGREGPRGPGDYNQGRQRPEGPVRHERPGGQERPTRPTLEKTE